MASSIANLLPTPTNDLQAYLRAIHKFPLLSQQQERELALRFRDEGDRHAAWQLVTAHLRFVVKIARGYRGYGLAEEDLIQEGNVGLMKAVRRFDPSLGVRLAAFAAHWIRAEIHDYVLRNWRIVKVATTKAQRKLFFKLRSARTRLGWMRRNELEQIADALQVRAEDVAEMERRLQGGDAAFDGDGDADGIAPSGYLEDCRYEPSTMLERSQWEEQAMERVRGALQDLDPRARDILVRRRLQEPKARLRELAAEYGISAERVRQIETETLRALRRVVAVPELVSDGASVG